MASLPKVKTLLILSIVALVVIIAVLFSLEPVRGVLPFVAKNPAQAPSAVSPGQVAVIDSDITVNTPLSGDVVASPLPIAGRTSLTKGTISFRLTDANQQVIASGLATASIDGSYAGQLEFQPPISPSGWLEVYTTDTPQGAEQNILRLPIQFKEYQVPTVTVYFSNSQKDPGSLNCGVTYPVTRQVAYSPQLVASALGELLLGPTDEEKAQGYFTSIPANDIKVQALEIKDGAVYVDFNQALQQGVGGSCLVSAIRSQITETLKAFSDTDQVIISVDGNVEEALQP